MLDRVEHDYADHLFCHGLTPGEWCDECKCICAESVTAFVAAEARANGYGATTGDSDDLEASDNEDLSADLDFACMDDSYDADGRAYI